MGEYGNMNGDFFAIVWLVVFFVIIVTTVWLVKAKKKRTTRDLNALRQRFDNGELNKVEYETKKRKILGD